MWPRPQPQAQSLGRDGAPWRSWSGYARLPWTSAAGVVLLHILAICILLVAVDAGCLTACDDSVSAVLADTRADIPSTAESSADWGRADVDKANASCPTAGCIASVTGDITLSGPPMTGDLQALLSTSTGSVAVSSNASSVSSAATTSTTPSEATSVEVVSPPSSMSTSLSQSLPALSQPPGTPGPSLPPSATPTGDATTHKPVATIPLAVGVSVGGVSLALVGIAAVLLWRRRRKRSGSDDDDVDENDNGGGGSGSLPRAESPPPRDTPDGLHPSASGLLFRGGSLQSRRPSGGDTSQDGGDDGNEGAAVAAVTRHYRTSSLRQGSILNGLYASSRFTPDAVAMHDVPRVPSVGPERQWRGPSPTSPTKPPEIPYDGRRFPPYYGIPGMELDGYAELPG
ncbi:hypothetical protein CMQ_469 [Grosmannia clavigera kw1407]|uniref:Uncharacterized protein n=1 Tax=Grosmannia clavigera (strain kw1407 / UAMH 11150) TaxID=655863 RepID=F0XDN2_GROCL|nr:uncharacterized protein CMQ_469 [Grosmannia clavigera kw1407]EFX03541.1 hypothetical protein CMQ_469 [Grosmannia clavigera kw1407]